MKPGIERVQALADISRSDLCCHSNKTRASIANVLNSAQLEGTPCHSPKLHPGPRSSVGMQRGTADTQTAVTNIRIGYNTIWSVLCECNECNHLPDSSRHPSMLLCKLLAVTRTTKLTLSNRTKP